MTRLFSETFAAVPGAEDVTCERSPQPFCAVATIGEGTVTYRSCAVDEQVCEEQRERALRAIGRGFVAGPPPVCRPATAEEIARPPPLP